MTIEELNERYEIPGTARFEAGPGGMTQLDIRTQGHQAQLMLHGAHVTHFCPAGGEPALWMSRRSWFAPGKPIRGGVPVCFPWFGPKDGAPNAPNHGFARVWEWAVESLTRAPGGRVIVTLRLAADDRTRGYWAGDFELRHTVTVADSLTMALETRNVGAAPFTICEALHSYFRVSDIRKVSVAGLAGVTYLDKVAPGGRGLGGAEAITFSGETDREYLNSQGTCEIDDPGLRRRIMVAKSGSDSTVVWNPWIAKAARMPDFDDDEWPGMLCVETANAADNAVTIAPGASHTMEARVSVKQRPGKAAGIASSTTRNRS